MMKFQNLEGFHHVPDQCCHLPAAIFHQSRCVSSCFFQILPNAAIPFLFHHAFSEHFIMIPPTLPFFTKADMLNPPYNPLWQPFLVCFSTSISNHPRLRAIPESNQIFSLILLSMKQSGNHPPQAPEVKPLE